ncbi:LAFE_0F05490g1_1 [Lachancea fermentati]|uniref:Protoporphyrinogen oxidase n=1 Tax=Lachancea fermentati TaxID=4955 RepID=A0A1G4MF70_LACFM|nr:LAFE_0F05490g1_1 [Lachancea fermentati]
MNKQLVKLPINAKIAVVGAGVAGLSFSYFLNKLRPDVQITVLDSSNRCGGYINSCIIQDGSNREVMVEKGPRTLRGASDGTVMIIDTLKALNKENTVQYIESNSEANRKFLLSVDNKLIQVPNSPGSLLKFLVSPLGKGVVPGMLGEPFREGPDHPGRDESAHNFITRRFGNEYMSKNIFSAIFHGIYAGDIKELSAKRTLGALVEMENKHGSLIRAMLHKMSKKKDNDMNKESVLSKDLKVYQQAMNRDIDELEKLRSQLVKYPMLGLKNGLETFPKALTEAITGVPNIRLLTGKSVSSFKMDKKGKLSLHLSDGEQLNDFDHLRITSNPAIISQMIEDSTLKDLLQEVQSNTVLLVNYYLPSKDVVPSFHSFGYLVPQSNENHEKLLGVIFDSVIEKNFKPLTPTAEHAFKSSDYTKLTAMLGGHYLNREGPHSVPSRSLIINAVKHAFSTQLHISDTDLDNAVWQVTVAENCLPQFKVGYDDWLIRINSLFTKDYGKHVSLGGMAFSKGPGVPDVVVDGFDDALALSKT